MAIPQTNSKAHEGAYDKGMRAAMDRQPMTCLYSDPGFKRFWYQGYEDGLWARSMSDTVQGILGGLRAFKSEVEGHNG